MCTSLLTAFLALFVAAAQSEPGPPQQIEGEELSDLLNRWPREYVGWIITDTERDQYKILETDTAQLIDIQNPERTIQLEEFVKTSVTFDRLSLRAASGMVYTSEGRVKVPVSIAVPYRELTASQSGEQAQYDLDYLILLTDAEGNEAARVGDRLTIRLSQEQYALAASQHLSIEESLEVEPGRYRLQAILRDNARERVVPSLDRVFAPDQQLFEARPEPAGQ